MWQTVHCYRVSAIRFCRDLHVKLVALDSCQTLWHCILPLKSWVSAKTHFKGVLCFLVFHRRHDIQHPIDGYLNGSTACHWFLRCPNSASGAFDIQREAADGNPHLGGNDAIRCMWELGYNTNGLHWTLKEQLLDSLLWSRCQLMLQWMTKV